MTDPGGADEARLRQVFDAAARSATFPPGPVGDRLLVLLGGQPAAGKTRAQAAILAEHPELVSITGDDLRAYHSGYRDLAVNDPLGMPAATAPTSSGLIRLALDYAIEHGYPVLLEGTFRDPAMVTGTAARFAEAGYRVEVVAVATAAPRVETVGRGTVPARPTRRGQPLDPTRGARDGPGRIPGGRGGVGIPAGRRPRPGLRP